MASTTFVDGNPLTAAQMNTLGDTVDGYTTTATAAGTSTQTVASKYQQFYTGSTTQSHVMPVTTTLVVGWKQRVANNSSGVVTIKTSDGTTIYAVPAGGDVIVTCILASGTTAASWDYKNHVSTATTPALTKILTASFSAVATTGTTFDGVFTSTYKKYFVVLSDMITSSSAGILYLQTRVAAVTKATNYYSVAQAYNYAGTGRQDLANNASQFLLGRMSDTTKSLYNITFAQVGNASEYPVLSMSGSSGYENGGIFAGGSILTNHTADGFILSASAGNISGSATVFGIVN